VVRGRKILLWVVIAFLVYAIFASPDQAADIVRAAIDGIFDGLSAIGRFFDSLLTG
jgi:hypothetical protein